MAVNANIPARPKAPVKVGISQCLLGDAVRYDGSGAGASFPRDALDDLFDYQAVCPEVGIGMTVPREPIRLIGTADNYRVLGVKDPSVDKTDALAAYARAQLPDLHDLAGYIFMAGSPSCGLQEVKVYATAEAPARREATGAYTAVIVGALPEMPVSESYRLFDTVFRENFVVRTFTYAHWLIVRPGITPTRLLAFHNCYKDLLQAHSTSASLQVDRLLSELKCNIVAAADEYIGILMTGLRPTARCAGKTLAPADAIRLK